MAAINNKKPPRMMLLFIILTLAFTSSNLHAAYAFIVPDEATTLDSVDVIGTRRSLSNFPGSITIVDATALQEGQRKVSLSESLARVPGITVLDRQNYAQDLQIQSRGFGARSTFGIRGVKLIVDGIPNSAADGQGQAGSFPLDALDRIEVLRGPLALQYGNAAGGVIVGYTDLENWRANHFNLWVGDNDSYRASAGLDDANESAAWRWRVDVNRFVTDGERLHSAAERSQLNTVVQWTPREGERISLTFNALSQPDTQDPLGLTRQALQSDFYGTDAPALTFNTRKSIENHQLGLQWQREYKNDRRVWLGAYYIERDVLQFLALPVGAQVPASNSGGVIDLGRRSTGIAGGHQWSAENGAISVGFDSTQLQELRRGYENYIGNELGVRGRLRRDELNRVGKNEVYAIADWYPKKGWSILGALRYSNIRFESDDNYFAAANGDDSGKLEYKESSISLGVSRAFSNGEIFASLGRGFETPTVTELAYRPDGSGGFNFGLSPAHFISAEIGARWRRESSQANITFYRVSAEDEIVPADSRGGRASFANAARTDRIGLEAGWSGKLGNAWTYALVANWIHARFDQSFSYNIFTNGVNLLRTVDEGNRIPGIPRADGYAELMWHSSDASFNSALEMRISDTIATDDRNTDLANAYSRFALRMAWRPSKAHGWNGFIRVDNLFNRQYVGSVIVNEANSRYFEPGAGRGFTIGIGWDGLQPK